MAELIWIHEDALSATHPVFDAAPEAPACFIFDPEYLQSEQYSLKRVAFICECLREMPVTPLKGSFEATLREQMEAIGARKLYAPDTPNPRFKKVLNSLARDYQVEIVPDEPFVIFDAGPDLKRFSRYWRRAKEAAMHPEKWQP